MENVIKQLQEIIDSRLYSDEYIRGIKFALECLREEMEEGEWNVVRAAKR